MKELPIRTTVVICTYLVALTVLMAIGRETAVFVGLGFALLGGIGVLAANQAAGNKEVQVVREQTNGTQTRMMDQLVEQSKAQQETNARLVEIIERQGALLAGMVRPEDLPGVAPPLELPATDSAPVAASTAYGRAASA